MLFYWVYVKCLSNRFKFAARLVKFFLLFAFILANICFYMLENILLRVGMTCGCTGGFPGKEDGVHVLIGLAQSSPTVGSLLITLWPVKPARYMIVLILIFIYLQTYIFDLSIRQTWLWFVTIGHLNILAIQPFRKWPLKMYFLAKIT